MDYSPPGFSVCGDSPGKNTEVGCHFFLQGIFPTQGSNPHLLHFLHWAGKFFTISATWVYWVRSVSVVGDLRLHVVWVQGRVRRVLSTETECMQMISWPSESSSGIGQTGLWDHLQEQESCSRWGRLPAEQTPRRGSGPALNLQTWTPWLGELGDCHPMPAPRVTEAKSMRQNGSAAGKQHQFRILDPREVCG